MKNPSMAVWLVVKACIECKKRKAAMGKKRCPECKKMCCSHLRSPSGACWGCVRKSATAVIEPIRGAGWHRGRLTEDALKYPTEVIGEAVEGALVSSGLVNPQWDKDQ